MDMFLPFGLRTAPRIFNYFAEALHWVRKTLKEWNVTHYLDDFLIIFPPNTKITSYSQQFDNILAKFGLLKATEKDSDDTMIIHLPSNKKRRALNAVDSLLSSSSVSFKQLEQSLGFLSHCC